ncbi:MAG: DUF423 domain-containing protein [Pseudomonadales bacterium]|nr:DUF423 domain-containing protein [Pseudomonadales bacterium]
MASWVVFVGALSGFFSVLLGAFAAHGLKQRLTEKALSTFQTGVDYQMYHSLGLVLLGLLMFQWPERVLLKWSSLSMMMGMLLFSGSLYVLAISGISRLGIVTPFGGLLFLIAWFLLSLTAFNEGRLPTIT